MTRPAFHRRLPALTGRRPRPSLLSRAPGRVALLALASMVAALLWPDRATDSVAELASVRLPPEVGPPTGPVEVVEVEAPVVWSDVRQPTVTAQLRSSADETVVARVWWLLADPDDPEPWERPTGRGAAVDVTVRPGSTAHVDLPAQEPPAAGTWTLSVWAHTVPWHGAAASEHSHGSGTRPYVTVLSTDDEVVRLGPPGPRVALTGVEATGRLSRATGADRDTTRRTTARGTAGETAGGPDAVVHVRSTSAQPVFVELRCYLAPPGTREPWEVARALASDVTTVTAESVPTPAGCDFEELPDDGTWELSVFARLSGRDDAVSHQDGLYARQTVVLVDGGSERVAELPRAAEAAATP